MPFLKKSSYTKRPRYFPNTHLETIVPSMFFKVDLVNYQRERMELIDGDFMDLDWVRGAGNKRVLLLAHGLEGNSERHYMKRPAKFFSALGWDVCAWNCRSCSGEMNRLPKLYHHGDIEDLGQVVDHVSVKYDEIVLLGYSMGGNMIMKYLGLAGDELQSSIRGAIGFSVPCHLEDSANMLRNGFNRIYQKRFLKKLNAKMAIKAAIHPEVLGTWKEAKSFEAFHAQFTLPVYGFEDFDAFFEQARSDVFLTDIRVPTLMVNAKNDPMLGIRNYPVAAAENSDYFFLETPEKGGHVGFTLPGDEYSWMEYRAHRFLQSIGL